MRNIKTFLFLLFIGLTSVACSRLHGLQSDEALLRGCCGKQECGDKEDIINVQDSAVPAAYAKKAGPDIPVISTAKATPIPKELIACPVISSDMLFDFDKYTIKTQGKKLLDEQVETMKKFPTLTLKISGHTDNMGSMEYNMILSKNRAEAAKNYLVEKGVDASRISTDWHAFTKPVASNDTPDGRSQNRRVEFKFVAPEP